MKLSTRALTLFLGVITALVMAVPTAANATTSSSNGVLDVPTAGPFYQLRNQLQFECLAGKSNERVDIAHCNPSFNDQWWTLEPAGAPGFYRLRVSESGKCMAVIKNGNVRMSNCVADFNDQWWRLDPVPGTNQFMLYNHLRQTCLAAPTINGSARPFTCTVGFTDQYWSFISR
jgi:hypothetical protein